MRRKITVVGAGNVGATSAQRLAERDYADVVLVDTDPDRALRLSVDMNVTGAVAGYVPNVKGSDSYADLSGSDVVVMAIDAGDKNAEVARGIAAEVHDRAPDAVLIIVSNPLEEVCHAVYEVLRFPRERVIGLAGTLHSAALRMLLAAELGVSPRDVDAIVLGGHADTMVPLLSCATVSGLSIRRRLPEAVIDDCVRRVREAAAPREAALAPVYAPAAAIVEIVDAIVLDQWRVLPCATLCKTEYGYENVFVGLPVKLAAGGIKEIVEVEMDEDERRQVDAAVKAVEDSVGAVVR
jgi:malate dehydrogenase